ncbi:MAG: hypothetical protein H6733_13080 [Alphaproteobacteria bacterium]|nr:hypothetical protein [Alphaproteobacteria bacterium]
MWMVGACIAAGVVVVLIGGVRVQVARRRRPDAGRFLKRLQGRRDLQTRHEGVTSFRPSPSVDVAVGTLGGHDVRIELVGALSSWPPWAPPFRWGRPPGQRAVRHRVHVGPRCFSLRAAPRQQEQRTAGLRSGDDAFDVAVDAHGYVEELLTLWRRPERAVVLEVLGRHGVILDGQVVLEHDVTDVRQLDALVGEALALASALYAHGRVVGDLHAVLASDEPDGVRLRALEVLVADGDGSAGRLALQAEGVDAEDAGAVRGALAGGPVLRRAAIEHLAVVGGVEALAPLAQLQVDGDAERARRDHALTAIRARVGSEAQGRLSIGSPDARVGAVSVADGRHGGLSEATPGPSGGPPDR